jgi:hypothetical protein
VLPYFSLILEVSIHSEHKISFCKAFPNVPWVFLYNTPETMLDGAMAVKSPSCLASRSAPPPEISAILLQSLHSDNHRYCTAQISVYLTMALTQVSRCLSSHCSAQPSFLQ